MTSISRYDKANAIRALSMDAVQRAACGHPGAPMGMADLAEVLWSDFLRHNPNNPAWPDRDRFVLSNGHASMLLYALLHLTGYAVGIDDLKAFRQLHSITPGHPEYGQTAGVEATTGPLGQGLANAVGMAIGEKTLAAQFNRPGHAIVDHYTYVLLGDGCLMEGISHEAGSLAGTLKLGKLIALYDDNGISIDGRVDGWFTDDTAGRFRAYGWHVIGAVDGHDAAAVAAAIRAARAETARPTLICCKTTIGFGAPNKAGTAASHGAPLGADEIEQARAQLGWPHAPFEVPEPVYRAWDARQSGAQQEAQWQEKMRHYRQQEPLLAAELERRYAGDLPADWSACCDRQLHEIDQQQAAMASRKASQQALECLAPILPELIGGSADLTDSNLTRWSRSVAIHEQDDGNYIHFGVREFAMAAILNGLALHRGFKPYGATFLMFSDYARNALRMSALMRQACIYVLTHDSVGLGEDGPTHQPIEQLATLRLIPNMSVWRPCDAVETVAAWQQACAASAQPVALILSRQSLTHQPRASEQIDAIRRGGYVLYQHGEAPQVLVMATGSEVELAVQAARRLTGYAVRVVSMPSTDRYDAQPPAYRQSVLPEEIDCRISIEAGATAGWARYVGRRGLSIGIDRFGESAPGGEALAYLGLSVEAVTVRLREYLGRFFG